VILLDTCAYLWLFSSPGQLSASARKLLRKEDTWLVSLASVWEIALKVGSGKITLKRDVEEWVEASLGHPKVSLVNLTPKSLILSSRLPEPFQKDPFDRVIVATAMLDGNTVVTRDQRILDYQHVASQKC